MHDIKFCYPQIFTNVLSPLIRGSKNARQNVN